MTENISYIPSRLKSSKIGGHVAGTEDIYDDELGKTQKEINAALIGGGGGTTIEWDDDPTRGSQKAVRSGGIYAALESMGNDINYLHEIDCTDVTDAVKVDRKIPEDCSMGEILCEKDTTIVSSSFVDKYIYYIAKKDLLAGADIDLPSNFETTTKAEEAVRISLSMGKADIDDLQTLSDEFDAFKTSVNNADYITGNKVQTLSNEQKAQARQNIGAGEVVTFATATEIVNYFNGN